MLRFDFIVKSKKLPLQIQRIFKVKTTFKKKQFLCVRYVPAHFLQYPTEKCYPANCYAFDS